MNSWANDIELWKKGQWHRKFLAVQGDRDEWQKVYAQYLKSDVWADIRLKAIVRAGYRCQRCEALYFGETKLQVHHKTYERVGGLEKDDDLEVFCAGECHRKADIKREQIIERKRTSAHYQARFNGWGKAWYKNDWDRKKYEEELDAEEEFYKFVYKEWCNKNDVDYYDSEEVPQLFIDLLLDGRENEYDEYYG